MSTDAKKKKPSRHASAIKRARQTIKKNARNASRKARVSTFEKKVLAAINSKNADSAKKALVEFMSEVDKAAQKGVVHVKRAARRVSRISKQISQISK